MYCMRKGSVVLMAAICSAMLLTLLAGSMSIAPVEAQSPKATSTRLSGGNATWTIQSQAFQSEYPSGFYFTIQGTSSAGNIKSVQALWRHGPGSQRRRDAVYDGATNTWKASW